MRGVLAALDETEYGVVVCNVAQRRSSVTSTSGGGAPLDRSDGLLHRLARAA